MADAPRPPVPAGQALPRAALERVLLRAAELHTASSEVPETLSEADLLALANEVGISPLAVRQALAEERMRVTLPEERGILASAAGPAQFAAARVVAGQAKQVLESLDRAFQRDENLAERRRFPDRVVWGARGGWAGVVRGLTRLDGRGFPLVKADEVSATVIQVEPTRVHVRIETATLARRANATRNALIGIVSGGAVATVGLVLSVMAPVAIAAGAAIGLGSAWIARRNYRRDAAAAQLAIEQALDRVEFGEPKKRTLLDQLLLPDK
jgi:hypothetical protein